ncbi:MAG: SANT/Myb-like DNA-binding domain-containing protein [Janthinobacterium lividum]
MAALLPIAPGDTFGRLTVQARCGSDASGLSLWSCTCACGAIVRARGPRLRDGYVAGCGQKCPAYVDPRKSMTSEALFGARWSDDEDAMLLRMRKAGASWATISLAIPPRSGNACRERACHLADRGHDISVAPPGKATSKPTSDRRCVGTDPDTGDRCMVPPHGLAAMCVICSDRAAWLRGKRAARRWASS